MTRATLADDACRLAGTRAGRESIPRLGRLRASQTSSTLMGMQKAIKMGVLENTRLKLFSLVQIHGDFAPRLNYFFFAFFLAAFFLVAIRECLLEGLSSWSPFSLK
jgi:hypothetical protein